MKTNPRPGWKPSKSHPMRATHRTRRRNPQLDPDLVCTVMLPGADPIEWRGLPPPETLRLQRVATPVRIEPDGRQIEAVFELVTFERTSVVGNMHAYEEVS